MWSDSSSEPYQDRSCCDSARFSSRAAAAAATLLLRVFPRGTLPQHAATSAIASRTRCACRSWCCSGWPGALLHRGAVAGPQQQRHSFSVDSHGAHCPHMQQHQPLRHGRVAHVERFIVGAVPGSVVLRLSALLQQSSGSSSDAPSSCFPSGHTAPACSNISHCVTDALCMQAVHRSDPSGCFEYLGRGA
jgi:hypothetical protein